MLFQTDNKWYDAFAWFFYFTSTRKVDKNCETVGGGSLNGILFVFHYVFYAISIMNTIWKSTCI